MQGFVANLFLAIQVVQVQTPALLNFRRVRHDQLQRRASLLDVIPVLERVASRANLLERRFDRRAVNASLARGLHLELARVS